jgi:hypothetical protein
MDDYQKSWVVMQEYNTLRSEILALYTGLTQATVALVGVLGALSTYGLTHDFTRTVKWLIGLSLILYLITQGSLYLGIFRLSAHLRNIEQRINEIAGETLLSWETTAGWGGDLMRRINSIRQSLP